MNINTLTIIFVLIIIKKYNCAIEKSILFLKLVEQKSEEGVCRVCCLTRIVEGFSLSITKFPIITSLYYLDIKVFLHKHINIYIRLYYEILLRI